MLNTIVLHGTDIKTSSLGFGCAGIMRIPGAAERQRVLGAAFDLGVRHFDTARMYGLGRSEGVLGRFLHGRRDQATIATKFGIRLNARAAWLGGVQSLARRLLAASPAIRKLARRRSKAVYQPSAFSAADAQTSLETSLRELKTDYVDLLLAHECDLASLQRDAPLEFLENAVRSGKARAYGIATTFENTLQICEKLPEYAPVAQFENNILERNVERLPGLAERATITHSPLSKSLDRVCEAITADPRGAAAWSERVGLDCGNRNTVALLLLAYCARANPRGIVLFQSTSPANVAFNVRAAAESRVSQEALDEFESLVAAHARQAPTP